ncbi:MAG TPA: hypothetical protein VMH32_15440 [Burkholderiales bacterium]|nr:hypothetical protein [Burkholderiales bacterium]
MPVTIDQMTTEVITEPQQQLAGAAAMPATDRLDELAKIRFALAAAAQLDRRTSAEGYDD